MELPSTQTLFSYTRPTGSLSNDARSENDNFESFTEAEHVGECYSSIPLQPFDLQNWETPRGYGNLSYAFENYPNTDYPNKRLSRRDDNYEQLASLSSNEPCFLNAKSGFRYDYPVTDNSKDNLYTMDLQEDTNCANRVVESSNSCFQKYNLVTDCIRNGYSKNLCNKTQQNYCSLSNSGNRNLVQETFKNSPRSRISGGNLSFAQPMSLMSIENVVYKYRMLFGKFQFFNIVQSTVFNDVYSTDNPLVVSAPTGSGKTVILELAIVRLLMKLEENNIHYLPMKKKEYPKIIYMAPLKALVSERYIDWKKKFEELGLICSEITGDTFHDDLNIFKKSQIILTTPEKWDSLTRRWGDNETLMKAIFLVLIDEVHVLNEEMRGPTLEAVISRMKTMETYYNQGMCSLRMIAVSATIPNAEDVACWLSNKHSKAVHYKLDESLRPVQLQRIVLGFSSNELWSDFRFDLSLNYKVASVIFSYSENKPTLVFVSTRKGAVQTALVLAKETRFVRNAEHKALLINIANGLQDNKLRECVLFGVGYHHAGIEVTDRRALESLFIEGNLLVLVSTSTLAMGVNLPAHLVIIKSTSQYVNGLYKEYPTAQILQMIGRAGRPQFDDHATAVIMTKSKLKSKYENLVTGKDVLESHLHKHLIEHLNAEIVLGTIQNTSVTVEWLRSTFLYVRVQKNPRYYGLQVGLSVEELELKLQEMCTREVNSLISTKLIEISDTYIHPTHAGRLMARYCVKFQTMKSFLQMKGDESLKELLEIISSSEEFSDIKLRTSDKRVLNNLNKTTCRFPIKGKVNTGAHKISCLIQSVFSCSTIGDYGLSQEATKVLRTGQRLTKCLFEYSFSRKEYELLLNALILAKVFSCHLWEFSKLVTRQLERIGPALANALVNAKIFSFTAIENTNPRDLEMICNRNPPFGNKLREQTLRLPRYELTVEQQGQVLEELALIKITITLANFDEISANKSTTPKNHSCLLLIGNSDNTIVLSQRITDTSLLQAGGQIIKDVYVRRSSAGDEININCISETWAGLDVQSAYIPRYLPSKFFSSVNEVPTLKDVDDPKKASEIKRNQTSDSVKVNNTNSTRRCLHSCSNKETCKHQCCKVGIASIGTVQDIKRKTGLLPNPTPSVKRLKLISNKKKEEDTETGSSLSRFNFSPSKQKFTFHSLPSVSVDDAKSTKRTKHHSEKSFINYADQIAADTPSENDIFNDILLNDSEIIEKNDDFYCDNEKPSFDLFGSQDFEYVHLNDPILMHHKSYPSQLEKHSENIDISSTISEQENSYNNFDEYTYKAGIPHHNLGLTINSGNSMENKNQLDQLRHTNNLHFDDSQIMRKLAQIHGVSRDVVNLPIVKQHLNTKVEVNVSPFSATTVLSTKPVAGVKPMFSSSFSQKGRLKKSFEIPCIPSSFVSRSCNLPIGNRSTMLSSFGSTTGNSDWDDLLMFQKYRQLEKNSLSNLYSNGTGYMDDLDRAHLPSQLSAKVSSNFLNSTAVHLESDGQPHNFESLKDASNSNNFNILTERNVSIEGNRELSNHRGSSSMQSLMNEGFSNILDSNLTKNSIYRLPIDNSFQDQRNFSNPQNLNIEICGPNQDIRINVGRYNVPQPLLSSGRNQKVRYDPRSKATEEATSGLLMPKGILKSGNFDSFDVQDIFEGII